MADTASLQADKAWLDQALAILADAETVRVVERIRRHLADTPNPEISRGFGQLLQVVDLIPRSMRARGAKAVGQLITEESKQATLL